MRSGLATVLLALLAAPAAALECRALLQPLLLATDPDPEYLAEVRAFCEDAAAAGDPDALYQSALFRLGLGGEWAPEEATPRIVSAATAGVAEAQYWLAWQRESGPLLADDVGEALYWYRQAAEREHRLALERLAAAYAEGALGLAVDEALAAEYRARAAACVD